MLVVYAFSTEALTGARCSSTGALTPFGPCFEPPMLMNNKITCNNTAENTLLYVMSSANYSGFQQCSSFFLSTVCTPTLINSIYIKIPPPCVFSGMLLLSKVSFRQGKAQFFIYETFSLRHQQIHFTIQ